MRTYDFSPYYRSSIGFDRMLDLLGGASRPDTVEEAWPPYDIERLGEDRYSITMALAGFAEDEITIVAEPNALLVEGRKKNDDSGRNFLHRGIAQRGFRRQFDLADFVKVTSASLQHGLLTVELEREIPEAMKPRRIEISTPTQERVESARENGAKRSAGVTRVAAVTQESRVTPVSEASTADAKSDDEAADQVA